MFAGGLDGAGAIEDANSGDPRHLNNQRPREKHVNIENAEKALSGLDIHA
jgi:hypothetical protein